MAVMMLSIGGMYVNSGYSPHANWLARRLGGLTRLCQPQPLKVGGNVETVHKSCHRDKTLSRHTAGRCWSVRLPLHSIRHART